MADKTVAEQITDLETKITTLDTTISNQQAIAELEEGGAGSRFRTEYANIDSLYRRRDNLDARLRTLRMGS